MAQTYRLPELYNDNNDGIITIAHRGASAYYPENTMVAFRAAVEMGAEMIELDVMLSKDGVPVVFHDARLDAHTNGTGPLDRYTFQQLQKLDAGSWFNEQFAGERIPSLEEVLKFASGTIALNIEIKPEAVTDALEGGVEQKSLELVKKYNMEKHVLFSSFDYRAVNHLKELDADVYAALLFNKRQSGGLLPAELMKRYAADAFNCSYRQLNRKRLQNLKDHTIPFFIYTLDDPQKMKKLIRKNVTGIFTNKPDLLKRVAYEISHR